MPRPTGWKAKQQNTAASQGTPPGFHMSVTRLNDHGQCLVDENELNELRNIALSIGGNRITFDYYQIARTSAPIGAQPKTMAAGAGAGASS